MTIIGVGQVNEGISEILTLFLDIKARHKTLLWKLNLCDNGLHYLSIECNAVCLRFLRSLSLGAVLLQKIYM